VRDERQLEVSSVTSQQPRVGPSQEDGTLRAIVVSDVPLVRQSLGALLRDQPGFEVPGVAEPGGLPALLALGPTDAVVLGLTLLPSAARTLDRVVEELRATRPVPALVVIGPHRNGLARALVASGTPRIAFLVDRNVADVETLARVVRDVCAGLVTLDGEIAKGALGVPAEGVELLTPREYEVLAEMAEGMSNQVIADHLHLTVKSVEAHITQIFRKLGLDADGEHDRRVRAVRMFLG
jgi:DNA-binding NarL/FixJ family response regulator